MIRALIAILALAGVSHAALTEPPRRVRLGSCEPSAPGGTRTPCASCDTMVCGFSKMFCTSDSDCQASIVSAPLSQRLPVHGRRDDRAARLPDRVHRRRLSRGTRPRPFGLPSTRRAFTQGPPPSPTWPGEHQSNPG